MSVSDREEQAGLGLQGQSFSFWRMLLMSLLALAVLAQWLPAGRYLAFYRSTMRQVWPQTWSFYSDVAGGSQVSAYRWSGVRGGLPEPLAVRQASRASVGGFRRTTHAQLAEVARVSAEIPVDRWWSCRSGRLAACLPASPEPAVTLVNPAAQPTLCGSVLLTIESRRSDRSADVVRTERLTYVALTCSRR
ncbi:hypothetical protein [Micromonospora violae]|uniref:hypothetical protein n=1 Tax=Micromonospora violae TaxID=1278207 RepID=UPI0033D43356